jgi:uncharacterized membrane protein (UPF0127 family)
MRFIVFHTREQQVVGLQHRPEIEDNTIFIFPGIKPGTVFHSRNVRAPFDIAFLDKSYTVLAKHTLTPEIDTAEAPPGTTVAIEAREGLLSRHGVYA